jgi:hypothetical protein
MIAQGHEWVVDIDLEKFFDRVNRDRLLSRVAKTIADKRLLKLTQTDAPNSEWQRRAGHRRALQRLEWLDQLLCILRELSDPRPT